MTTTAYKSELDLFNELLEVESELVGVASVVYNDDDPNNPYDLWHAYEDRLRLLRHVFRVRDRASALTGALAGFIEQWAEQLMHLIAED